MKPVLVVLAVMLVLTVMTSCETPVMDGNNMYPGGHMGFGYGYGGWFMSIVWIVFIVMLGFLLFQMMRGQGGTPGAPSGGPAESPLDILKRRYANGEITREQFDSMKRDIGS